MIINNSVMKSQNLLVNNESQPVKSNPGNPSQNKLKLFYDLP